MAWTLSGSGGAAAGTLTAQQPIADLHVPISGPAGEVTLGLRRLDSTACGSVVTWEEPGLELPSPRWPWA
jgi:hypothetical protein